MESLNPGTTVYFCWYDFSKKSEYLCKGEVVDNSDYQDTQWADFVYVRFQPTGISKPICHHFLPERLSTDQSNVLHDDCTLVCAKRMTVNTNNPSASDTWKMVLQFKQDHWDYQHGHINTEVLDEYYQLWHDAIAAKRGFKEITKPYSEITKPYSEITKPYSEITKPYSEISAPAPVKSVAEPQQPKRIKKAKSTNIIELSFF